MCLGSSAFVQWVLIIGSPVLFIAILLMFANRFRADILVEVEDTVTKVSKYNGSELLYLSNQLITRGTGANETIIAVGKPGEYGFPSAPPLPPDAIINDLLNEALRDEKRGAKLWNQFLRYCGAVGISELRGKGFAFNMAFPVSRVYVHSKLNDTRINNVLFKSLGGWLSCSAPQLIKLKSDR